MKEKIHIIGGRGSMGKWLVDFFEICGLKATVSGRKSKNDKDIVRADVIFISVPNSVAPTVIEKASKIASKECLIVDLSSVKGKTVPKLRSIDQPSCSMHMMFGPSQQSIKNQTVVLISVKKSKKIESLKKLLSEKGAHIIEMDETAHDESTAITQGLVHFINIAFSKTLLREKKDITKMLTTPVFLSQYSTMSRILSQKKELLSELQMENKFVNKQIQLFLETADSLSGSIRNKRKADLERTIGNIQMYYTPRRVEKKVVKESVGIEISGEKYKVSYLGPTGTYTHQAAEKVTLKSRSKLIPKEDIYLVFESVKSGESNFGVVPIENSTEGTVRETLDYLLDFDLKAVGQTELEISHSLLSYGKDIQKITQIFSHPQAIAQSRGWIKNNLPNALLLPAKSTVSEIGKNRNDYTGFIASRNLSREYRLNILATSIQDRSDNITKFYVVAKSFDALSSVNERTLFVVSVFNRVGVLRDILNIIASFNINVNKLESRPSREKVWDYDFFFEVQQSYNDPRFSEMTNVLREYCTRITILGTV